MDGVLADFERGVYETLLRDYPTVPAINPSQRTTFYTRDDYLQDDHPIIDGITHRPGFFLNLPLIEGALDGFREMWFTKGLYVTVCSSPLSRNKYCIPEKLKWLASRFEGDLGEKIKERAIIIKDKSLVRGDILVDDRPSFSDRLEFEPSWEHVLFTQPYNENVTGKRRLNWDNWKEVLQF